MRGAYLALLVGSWLGVALVDRRWRLALARRGRSRRRAVAVVALGSALLLAWDVVAIAQGFYARGDSPALLGVWLAPHLPLEEVVFVAFLCHLTLVVAAGVGLVLDRAPGPRERS